MVRRVAAGDARRDVRPAADGVPPDPSAEPAPGADPAPSADPPPDTEPDDPERPDEEPLAAELTSEAKDDGAAAAPDWSAEPDGPLADGGVTSPEPRSP